MLSRAFPIGLVAASLAPLWSQTGAAPAAKVTGFEVMSAEVYTGNLNYAVPIGPAIHNGSLGDGLVWGTSTAIGWHSSAGDDGLSVVYRVSYERNTMNSGTGGLSQNAHLQWRREVRPRLTLLATGSGSSETFLSFMENSLRASPLATDSAGNLVATGVSPFELSLVGLKRRELQGGLTAQYVHDPRSFWSFQLRGSRELAASAASGEAGLSDYPGATTLGVSASYGHRLSRRTTLATDLGYMQTYSALVPNSLATADIKLQRELTPEWLCFVDGGYGLLMTRYDGIGRSTLTPRGQVGLEWKARTWFADATALETAGDAYGVGATHRSALQVAAGHAVPGSRWRYQASVGYERLAGQVFPLIRDWVVAASVARTISEHVDLRVEGIWTTEIGSVLTIYPHLNRQGIRLSLFWMPAPRK